MASSSTKQAELRRLMKLQLEKQKQQELEQKAAPPKSILKNKKTKPHATSGVSSLLADYSEDDDEATGTQQQESSRVSWPEQESELKRTRIIESTTEPERKRVRLEVHETETASDNVIAPSIQLTRAPPRSNANVDMKEKVKDKTKVKAAKEKPVDPETWNEFQALLDEADKPPPSDEEPTPNTATEKQNVLSNEEEPLEEEEERVDTTEIEQVSYEARIAQLRLKAAARKRKKTAPAPASVDTYTPELALRMEEDDDRKPTASDGPTPLEILRQKRQEKMKTLNDS